VGKIDFDVKRSDTANIIMHGMGLDVNTLDITDVSIHRAMINLWLLENAECELLDDADPLDATSGGNIIKQLKLASTMNGNDFTDAILKAYRKAENLYYYLWSKGKIKTKKEPMSEETKAMLRGYAIPKPKKPEIVDDIKLRDATDSEIHKLFSDVYGSTKTHTVGYKRKTLIELQDSRIESLNKQPTKPVTVTPEENTVAKKIVVSVSDLKTETKTVEPKAAKEVKVKPAKKAKTPVWQDKALQKEIETKYPWVVHGSFAKDAEHESKTVATIKCTFDGCHDKRSGVHMADLFQVKLCLKHKGKKSAAAVEAKK
jgi:hypothetical protein